MNTNTTTLLNEGAASKAAEARYAERFDGLKNWRLYWSAKVNGLAKLWVTPDTDTAANLYYRQWAPATDLLEPEREMDMFRQWFALGLTENVIDKALCAMEMWRLLRLNDPEALIASTYYRNGKPIPH